MAKKQMLWKTKGMNQDLSVSAFNPEFSFENMNLRLSTNEGNTLMSWVNEKGTKKLSIKDTGSENSDATLSITGTPIGTAIINHKLVLFTIKIGGDGSVNGDYIYVIEFNENKTQLQGKKLYKGHLGFDATKPLETLVSYESEYIQKVYWTDGNTQPKVVNIVSEHLPADNNNPSYFDFVPTLQLNETVTVNKILGGNGTFAPGVIQYAFTYYNKYGQESNIFYTTPLLYISHLDRGASPEDKVDNAFKITVNNIDTNFEYLRIYSIQRTSINGTPICKRIQDISLSNLDHLVDPGDSTKGYKVTYTDTGTSGDSIDPTELFYKGGETIKVGTIEQKDGTLFMGDINITRDNLQKDYKDSVKSIAFCTDSRKIKPTIINKNNNSNTDSSSIKSYEYASQLTATDAEGTKNVPCSGFKYGDIYRCGIQFQHKSGKWSDPLYIKNVQIDGGRPTFGIDTVTLSTIKGVIPEGLIESITESGYVKARAVVVFPEMKDRVTVCQGIVCPTLFTDNHKTYNKDLQAQASWFFRCPTNDQRSSVPVTYAPFFRENENDMLPYTSSATEDNPYNPISDPPRRVEIQGEFDSKDKFKVGIDTLTLNSPDIEFDDQLAVTNFSGMKYHKAGEINFASTFSDIDIQTETPTISNTGSGFVHKSFSEGKTYGIISGLFYDDYIVDDSSKDLEAFTSQRNSAKWMIYPWQGSGSLNNDINRPADRGTQTAKLKKKIISNLRYADEIKHKYVQSNIQYDLGSPQLFNSDEVSITKLEDDIYQGNIDTLLTPKTADGLYFCWDVTPTEPINNKKYYIGIETPFNSDKWWKTWSKNPDDSVQEGIREWKSNKWTWIDSKIGDDYVDLVMKKSSVRMKYKSTPHLVFKTNINLFDTTSSSIDNGRMLDEWQLPLVEIQTNNTISTSTLFGGESQDALKENTWLPCGEPVRLDSPLSKVYVKNGAIVPQGTTGATEVNGIIFYYSYGDTYFQRWDCLKTYAFTPEDINQIVEIASFPVETRVNIDGRYDRNRGQINNLNMSPRNFNLINPVYSQKDNFFSYKIQDEDFYKDTSYPNQITWSKTKNAGMDVDPWTNITLASTLEMDGDKGRVNKLIRFNNFLFAFQDRGISQILYNDNVQISSTQGVPIEIANSGKVQGKDYKSDTIGCSNKWSMTTTPNGIYFMDSNDKSIYLFNGQLQNLSSALGFNSWCKLNIPSSTVKWNPYDFENFVAYYDKKNQDVLFINDDKALAYSEKLGAFTSFYNYGKAPFFCNLDDTGIWINKKRGGISTGSYYLWKHQGGDKYCNFFGKDYPYWMTLVGNPEPTTDKIFTNLEFRACVDGDGEPNQNADKFSFYLPFDSLETWNEYQHGKTTLSQKNGHSLFKHGGSDSALIRKFRIWRCDIPRDNYSPEVENSFDSSFDSSFHGVSRKTHPTDRMRNPWLYLKLMKEQDTDKKTEIHDMVMTYFG